MSDSYRISREALERAVHALEIARDGGYITGPKPGQDADDFAEDFTEIADAYDELRAIQGEHEAGPIEKRMTMPDDAIPETDYWRTPVRRFGVLVPWTTDGKLLLSWQGCLMKWVWGRRDWNRAVERAFTAFRERREAQLANAEELAAAMDEAERRRQS